MKLRMRNSVAAIPPFRLYANLSSARGSSVGIAGCPKNGFQFMMMSPPLPKLFFFSSHSSPSFALIELLVVIAIIAVRSPSFCVPDSNPVISKLRLGEDGRL
jgi:hypothetical protein